MKKIRLHSDLIVQIAKEFKVTTQTVRMSLRYVFNSPQNERIRARAKQLLEKEAGNVIIHYTVQ